ncbi:MAG: penicillin-binding transpeptidase domain-containing protein [Bacillota bacterium]
MGNRVPFRFRRRAALILCFFFLLFAAVLIRLCWLQVAAGEELAEKGRGQQLREIPVEAPRGAIRDRNGEILALSVTADSVYARPTEIGEDDAAKTAAALAELLGGDEADYRAKLTSGRSFEWIARKIDDDVAAGLRDLELPGIGLTAETKRVYPQGILACHVLGFAGIDNQGLEGIEAIRDDVLAGSDGAVLASYDSHGREIAGSVRAYQKPVSGSDLTLTIDENIQFFCERELDAVMNSSVDPKGATAVVMEPKTGEILALASRPGYDPNDYGAYDSALWRNTAVSDFYEPGSTAKILTISAALEENAVKETDTFYDRGYISVGRVKIRCWARTPHGSETFVEVAENSCNPAFVEVGRRIDRKDPLTFYRYLKSFGIGALTGLPLPGESSGSLRAYDEKTGVNEVEIANMYIGQGYGVTPVQLITAVSAAVNGGTLMEPHLVKEISGSGEIAPKAVRRVISAETSERVRAVLESVVANGTGGKAYLPGFRVGGKTGTAQKFVDGAYSKSKYVASFIGAAPMDDPRVVCLVVIDEPGSYPVYGGTIAAPVCKRILADTLVYLGVEQKLSEEEIEKAQKEAETAGEEPDLPETAATVLVPAVTGLEREEAAAVLADAGLNVRFSGSGQKVTAQTPAILAEVSEGTTVLLTMGAAAASSFSAPDLTGKAMLESEEICSKLGLVFIPKGKGRCVAQTPAAGEPMTRGDVITVVFEQAAGEEDTLD